METLAVTRMSLSCLIYDQICCLFDNKVNVLVSIAGVGTGLAYGQVTELRHLRTMNPIAFGVIRKIFSNRSFGFCNRLVSAAHATLAVALASLSVEDWSCPVCPVASKSSPKQLTTLAVTLSYLIYDLVCCLFDKQFSLDNTLHHLVSIVGITAGLAYGKSGTELVAALWVSELSSPFLHIRELIKELGYKDTNLNLAADISFAVIFTIARMAFGSYITFVTVSASNPLIIQVMAVGLLLVSAFWFFKIARMVKHKLTKRTASKKVA